MSGALLAGWSRRLAVGGVVLVPPDAPAARGLIRIHDREPRRPLAAIVARLGSGGAAGSDFTLSDGPHPLVTHEGEHAAFVECRLRGAAAEVQRSVGIVMGDEHFAIIDGRVDDPARFQRFHDVVLALTWSYSLGLGTNRWRPFHYQPPAGWRGLGRVRSEVWLAPSFPRRRGTITVFHARPLTASATARQHRALYEDLTSEVRREGEARPAAPSRHGLTGLTADLRGDDVAITNVAFEDDRYVYLLRMEADEASDVETRRAFAEVAASARPIPRPAPEATTPASLWLDD